MSLLVRKIDLAKWLQADLDAGKDVSADAITICMRTRGNKLSVWEIENETHIHEAVLAIVAGGQHLETIYVVTINSDYIRENGINLLPTEGQTPIDALKKIHRNLCELTYCKLGVIAYYIAKEITQKKVERFTEGRLKNILREALGQGRLEPNELDYDIRKKLS